MERNYSEAVRTILGIMLWLPSEIDGLDLGRRAFGQGCLRYQSSCTLIDSANFFGRDNDCQMHLIIILPIKYVDENGCHRGLYAKICQHFDVVT